MVAEITIYLLYLHSSGEHIRVFYDSFIEDKLKILAELANVRTFVLLEQE